MLKVCSACNKEKPESEFYWTMRRNGEKARHSKCQPCRRLQFSLYARTDRGKEVKRNGILRREYGLSATDYDAMLAQQNGACAICERPESKVHRDGSLCRLAVDHDHDTGMVRGLLCGACNVGIGSFDDCPELLEAAALYLKGQAARTEALERQVGTGG